MGVSRHNEHIINCNHRVRMVLSNWDLVCQDDMNSGNSFRITERGATDKHPIPTKYSIHSSLYGSNWEDEHAFEDMFSCECHRRIGSNYEGTICPHCEKEVKYVGIDLNKRGWIILDNDYIIQPSSYKRLHSYIGKKVFPKIINYVEPIKRERQEVDKNPFYGIGIREFRERFDEIMDYYFTTSKAQAYFYILSDKSKVFTHCIPVISKFLREFVIKGEQIRYTDEDKLYRIMFNNHQLLNDGNRFEQNIRTILNSKKQSNEKYKSAIDVLTLRRENILYSIQDAVNKFWDKMFDNISQKGGTIINDIDGGRYNFTGRNVITPDPTLNAHQTRIGYITFLELYKPQITSLMVNIHGYSYPEAERRIDYAKVKFSEEIYELMNTIIQSKRVTFMLNRNPTINYGSEWVLRVVGIIPALYTDTLALNPRLLDAFNADFDGDQMNMIAEIVESISDEFFRKMNPRSNGFVSRVDGMFNPSTNLFKDEIAGIYAFGVI